MNQFQCLPRLGAEEMLFEKGAALLFGIFVCLFGSFVCTFWMLAFFIQTSHYCGKYPDNIHLISTTTIIFCGNG